MRIQVHAGHLATSGRAPDDAETIDADLSRLMFGVVCYEEHEDGSLGRAVWPTSVTAPREWLVGDRITPEQAALARAAARYLNSCEALAARDPGTSPFSSPTVHQEIAAEMIRKVRP